MFQRIIERGIKLDRLDILLTAGTGFFSESMPSFEARS